MAGASSYYEVITAAINDIAQHGYDSEERINFWAQEIRRAAEGTLKSEQEVEAAIRDVMGATYRRQVDNAAVLQTNPGVKAYTLQQIRPQLHAELNRRIAASVNLIKLNRPEALAKTMRRFRGWATSVPAGGSKVDKKAEKLNLRKALASLPFEERRVIIDQNAKLVSAINSTVAENGGAVGAIWFAHGPHQRGYDGRPEHNARDGHFFLVRGSWAQEAGLVKPGANGYTDAIEQPAELPFCRCHWQYVYSLRSVPRECLTNKGQAALDEARRKVRNAA